MGGMPGGQFTNLREQARSLGIDEVRWPEVANAYAEVNDMFGDIVKVTPTSKVVGDLAIMMVTSGLTRAQVLQVLALEGVAWTTLGAIAGMVLGLAVAAVLVYVVNPQSFHWSMDMQVPLQRLLALAAAVIAAGTLTAWLAGRAAAGRDAVMAVKEDW